MNIKDSKSLMREEMRARLRNMEAARRVAASTQACALLERQHLWAAVRSVLFYAPLPAELDVWPLLARALAAGKTIALPRFDPNSQGYVACRVQDLEGDIVRGRFGIREPAGHCAALAARGLGLVLVPGVAFDLRGGRLGRGGGYYDRLLAQVPGATCGVAFDEQIVQEIPVEAHDTHVNFLLTPTRWVEIG